MFLVQVKYLTVVFFEKTHSFTIMAQRDGFELPPIGGCVKKPDGFWEFVEGEGSYQNVRGDMQWVLRNR